MMEHSVQGNDKEIYAESELQIQDLRLQNRKKNWTCLFLHQRMQTINWKWGCRTYTWKRYQFRDDTKNFSQIYRSIGGRIKWMHKEIKINKKTGKSKLLFLPWWLIFLCLGGHYNSWWFGPRLHPCLFLQKCLFLLWPPKSCLQFRFQNFRLGQKQGVKNFSILDGSTHLK